MAIIEGEMSVDPSLKVQSGRKGANKFVYNYEEVCAVMFGRTKCYILKTTNTYHL